MTDSTPNPSIDITAKRTDPSLSHSSPRFPPILWKLGWIGLSLALTALVALLDRLAGTEVALAIFYLVPIVLISWTVHEIAGVALSIPCAFIAAYENELQQLFFSFHPGMATWSFITRLVFFVLTAVLIGRFRTMVGRIRQMAMVDDLTGAYNVRAFFDILHKELRRSHRSGLPLTVVYLDLDNFKTVNDSLGHQAGNAVLRTVARAMLDAVRQTDSVGRMGGDEFAILLPETGEAEARITLPRIQSQMLAALRTGHWPVTVSIGVLICEHAACTTDEIFRRADSLMYQVKNTGKNGIQYEIAGPQ